MGITRVEQDAAHFGPRSLTQSKNIPLPTDESLIGIAAGMTRNAKSANTREKSARFTIDINVFRLRLRRNDVERELFHTGHLLKRHS